MLRMIKVKQKIEKKQIKKKKIYKNIALFYKKFNRNAFKGPFIKSFLRKIRIKKSRKILKIPTLRRQKAYARASLKKLKQYTEKNRTLLLKLILKNSKNPYTAQLQTFKRKNKKKKLQKYFKIPLMKKNLKEYRTYSFMSLASNEFT